MDWENDGCHQISPEKDADFRGLETKENNQKNEI